MNLSGNLGGRKAHVLKENPLSHRLMIKFEDRPISKKRKFKAVLVRVLLGSTILIPLITLIGKMHLRKKYGFELQSIPQHNLWNKNPLQSI